MDPLRRGAPPECIITIGGGMFIIVLYVAAYWEPDIRWLHFLQSWMYFVAIGLSWRGNSSGYFIGISAASLWNYFTLFVNTFFKNGLHQVSILLRSGHVPDPTSSSRFQAGVETFFSSSAVYSPTSAFPKNAGTMCSGFWLASWELPAFSHWRWR
jgi:hypothetical protein